MRLTSESNSLHCPLLHQLLRRHLGHAIRGRPGTELVEIGASVGFRPGLDTRYGSRLSPTVTPSPSSAGEHPGARNTDQSGRAAEANAFKWAAISAACDEWVAEATIGYAEEVLKLVAALRRNDRLLAAVQRSVLALRLPVVMAIHHRLLYESENRLWSEVADAMPAVVSCAHRRPPPPAWGGCRSCGTDPVRAGRGRDPLPAHTAPARRRGAGAASATEETDGAGLA